MVNVIGVRFKNAGKLYFFDPGEHWPTPGDYVVVETTRGTELGEVVTPVQALDDEHPVSLNQVIRVATQEDIEQDRVNRAEEKEAFTICQHKIGEHRLEMKLVGVEYTFDRSKLLFYFTANGRVDFRSLVKDLASVFHTRIELRQIGVRDEAKMLGGLGPCGRPICCGTFLGDFQPVSIKMAKEQNLSLNPTKISGVCGRLMCCLKYEEDIYEQTRKRMPRVGREIRTPDGWGTVRDLNIIRETVRVWVPKGDSGDLRDYSLEDLKQLNQPGAPAPEANPEAAAEGEQPAADAAPAQRPPRPDRPSRRERGEKGDRPPRERGDRGEKGEKGEKPDRAEKADRAEKGDKGEKTEKGDRPEKGEKGEKNTREGRRREDRRGGRGRRGEAEAQPSAPAQPEGETPDAAVKAKAQRPEPVRRTAPAAAQTSTPAEKGSSWRAALEQAMQAAGQPRQEKEQQA